MPHEVYIVRQNGGHKICTCADYQFRQAAVNGKCKHIKLVEDEETFSNEKHVPDRDYTVLI